MMIPPTYMGGGTWAAHRHGRVLATVRDYG